VGAVIARRAFIQVRISAVAWAVTFGATVAASALSYVKSFPTGASRLQLAATTGGDTGLAIVLGPVSAIDTVGGYTVYKCFVFLTSLGAVWAILAATRLLRGEEDAGRWQLLLAGGTRPSRATAATLGALGAAVAVIFAGTTLLTALVGRSRDIGFGGGECVVYGLSIAIAPAVFAAVGAVTSQISRTRRLATGLGIGGFGLSFVVRMIADSGPGLRWLLWLTPFGWTELMRPFTRNDLWPLLPAGATVAGLSVAAIMLASRRDAGDGALSSGNSAPLRPLGLRSSIGLTVRLELPVLVAWCTGVAATGFAFGIISKVATGHATASLTDSLQQFGVHGSFARQYFGVAFLIVATMVALLPAGQVGAASEEETSGRLVHVLAQPVNRSAVFAGRLGLNAVAVALAGLLAGLLAWLGAKTQGTDLSFGSVVGAGLNVVPTALVALGIGAVLLSVAPRSAGRAVYAVVLVSLLVDLFGSLVSGRGLVSRLSLFHYMALAPGQAPNPVTIAITLAAAVALCAAATALFARRDAQIG
jgi:ABC-2 type transport system permease protein